MDRQEIPLEANRQLAIPKYYQPISHSIQPQTQEQIISIIQSLYNQKCITAKQRDFLSGPNQPHPCLLLYLLPKIHKNLHTWTVRFEVPSGRPIVWDCSSSTYNIAQYTDFLGPLSAKHPSYIRDITFSGHH